MKAFVIDLARCNGCHNCQIACKDEHCGNEWLPYALPQPDVGHFWCKVASDEQGQTPKVRVNYKPLLCNHCESCALLEAAPDAVHRRDDGLVIIDPVAAAGRQDLVEACPQGRVFWNEELQIPQKCTGCAHLVDAGEVPHCVDLCPTGALRFGEEGDFDLTGAETEVDAVRGPRVFYLNDPKLFVSGEVWDPETDEIIEGARVTLSGPGGMRIQESTDGFGDFWFKRLDAGSYHLAIEAGGYISVERDIEVTESLNVGDFPLERA